MTTKAAQPSANECEYCHLPVVTLDGVFVHKVTLRTECPTAGNLSKRTNTHATQPSAHTPDSVRLADDLRAARTVWLMEHGVPISFEFANFANMVGAAEKFLRQLGIAAAEEIAAEETKVTGALDSAESRIAGELLATLEHIMHTGSVEDAHLVAEAAIEHARKQP